MPCVIEFTGGDRGPWRVTRAEATAGARLEEVAFVSVGLVSESEDPGHLASSGMAWRLRGAISNLRYTTRDEANRLRSLQAALDRPTATHAALIPINLSSGGIWLKTSAVKYSRRLPSTPRLV